MNRHLLLLIAVFLLLISWSINFRHYLRTWSAQFRSKPSIAKRKRKNKNRPMSLLRHSLIIPNASLGGSLGHAWDTRKEIMWQWSKTESL